MVSSENIHEGTVLTEDMVTYRNPGTGIPSKDANQIIGKISISNISENELLRFDMFE